MGSIFRFEHKVCGFEYKHFDGSGFTSMELEREALEKIKAGDLGSRWQELLESNGNAEVIVQNSLFYCEKCKKYHSLPQIKLIVPSENIEDENTILIKEELCCPKCNEKAMEVENLFSAPCPICGEKLKGEFIGLWD